jgi:hypothetical protein
MSEDEIKQISCMPPNELIQGHLDPPDRKTFNKTVVLGYNDLNAPELTKEEYEANIKAVEDLFETAGLHLYYK